MPSRAHRVLTELAEGTRAKRLITQQLKAEPRVLVMLHVEAKQALSGLWYASSAYGVRLGTLWHLMEDNRKLARNPSP